jgi:hypothetical protein
MSEVTSFVSRGLLPQKFVVVEDTNLRSMDWKVTSSGMTSAMFHKVVFGEDVLLCPNRDAY